MSKVFISYSTKNSWLIEKLINLIKTIDPSVDLFCSSDDTIEPGTDFNEEIYEQLEASDVFVAILSTEYWKSKYCILELGAAYQRYLYDETNRVSIKPMHLPPLDHNTALANTPLSNMQVTDLTNPRSLKRFFKMFENPESPRTVGQLEIEIAEYSSFVHKHVLASMSFLSQADVGAYYDERPNCPLPKSKIVRYTDLGNEEFLFKFRLSRLDYRPSFASVALMYWGKLNLKEFLRYDNEAAFCFDVENVDNALASMTVEFKTGEIQRVFHTTEQELVDGANKVRIPLASINPAPLSEIDQICFVIHPEAMNSMDGEVVISNIDVDFGERNILKEALPES